MADLTVACSHCRQPVEVEELTIAEDGVYHSVCAVRCFPRCGICGELILFDTPVFSTEGAWHERCLP